MVWRAERYLAIQVRFNFEIGLRSMLYFCFSWLTEITLELCQHVLKLTLWFVCRSCVAIAPVVQFYQEGPFQPAGRYVFNVCLLYDMDAHEFGLLHYAFVDLQGA